MPLGRRDRDRRKSPRSSRSLSPLPNKHRRSWQPSPGRDDSRQYRHPDGGRGRGKRPFKSNTFRSKDFYGPPSNRRSRSPPEKRPRPRSPDRAGSDFSTSYDDRYGGGIRGRSGSRSRGGPSTRSRQSTFSSRPSHSRVDERGRREERPRSSRSPEDRHPPALKRRSHQSPIQQRKRTRSRSKSPPSTQKKPKHSSTSAQREGSVPKLKVSSSSKKKAPRLTLHKRFTGADDISFKLDMKDNVTIAIVRNPDAEPSEDVTVQRIFDSSLFKMVHRKNEGRKPIFDREEIKVWRHDENLSDHPDFERRLIRVKSSEASKMSPDVIRKAFGMESQNDRSRSRSGHREQQIRLDPRPDPKYESSYRQQIESEEEIDSRRRDDGRRRDYDKKDDPRMGKGGDAKSKDMYDLRQALERRRSDREDGGFRVSVKRDRESSTELFYRDSDQADYQHIQDNRNVVIDGERGRDRYNDGPSRGMRRGDWDDDRFRGRGNRGGWRGRGGKIRGQRRNFSRERDEFHGDDRGGPQERDFQDRNRSFDRNRYSVSPASDRDFRGGFRGRGRGRGRDFGDYDIKDKNSPGFFDETYYKYTQHDDRDVSPRTFRGRPGMRRGRFNVRRFGSNNFRGNRGFRRPGRGFRRGSRGRGGKFEDGKPDDSSEKRSSDGGGRDLSLEREWKHDMYDSLQLEEEQPHSTTSMGT